MSELDSYVFGVQISYIYLCNYGDIYFFVMLFCVALCCVCVEECVYMHNQCEKMSLEEPLINAVQGEWGPGLGRIHS